MTRVDRYQLYHRLMSLCVGLSVVFLVFMVGVLCGWDAFHALMPRIVRRVIGSILLLNLFLAIYLVLARGMRDEFAERIWQKTAKLFVCYLVSVPALVSIALIAFEDRIRLAVREDWVDPELLDHLHKYPNPVWHMVGGAGWMVIFIALLCPTLFIILYKWALWRESR